MCHKKSEVFREQRVSIISIAEFDIHLSRKHIKNVILRIDRHGNVKVSAPMRCSLDFIQQFLHKKQDWIRTNRARLSQQPLPSSLSFESGEEHLFLGQPYVLKVHEYAEKNSIIIEGNYLCCYVKSPATQADKRTLISQWQRQQMQLLLPALFQKWQAIIGVQVHQWGIRTMKTRWGSCNTTKKRICLNLHLIQYPLVCLEYVVVHELVHLLEASHNQRFYALMTAYMPNWKEFRNLLNKNTTFA